MMYDASKYRALGIGEHVDDGDCAIPMNGSDELPSPVPCRVAVGNVVGADDAYIYLRPLEADFHRAFTEFAGTIGLKTDIGRKAFQIAIANVQLLDRKQQDYGSANIAAFGEYGVLVRVFDKVARLRNLLTNVKDPSNEPIMDSWVDIGNYAIIAQICRRGEWK